MDVDFPALPLYLGDYLWCVPYRNLKERQVRLGVGLEKAPSGDGLEIVMVAADTPAARAGLEKGDVLLSCDGQSLDDPLDLSLYLLRRQPGDEIELRIKRHGRPLTLPVRLIPDE
jgi:S1-C subfamily serine protease